MDIVSRAKNMLMSPAREWPVVASEPTSVGALYQGYIAPLAAIPPVATLIGLMAFYHSSFGGAVLVAIVSYVLSLIGVFVVAWIAGKLAPMFGGTDNMESGLKLVAYGSTATWVGGIFHIVPALGILSLLASIYGIYLFYTGVTPTMNVPTGRVIGYLIALIVAVIVVYVIIFALVGAIAGAGMMGMGMM
jgi:hypothetical protein